MLFNVDCPLLTLVSIGEGSFSEGSQFVLENNPFLITLIVNKRVFGSGKIDGSSVIFNGIIDKYRIFYRFTFTWIYVFRWRCFWEYCSCQS